MGMPKELKNGDKLQLNAGSVLRIIPDVLEYTVTATGASDAGRPTIELTRTCCKDAKFEGLCPETISRTFEKKDQGITIGRKALDIMVPEPLISRSHGVIRYSESGGFFYYYHNGLHPTILIDAPVPAASTKEKNSTVRTILDAAGKKPPEDRVIPLQVGSYIAFHRHTPIYKVYEADPKKKRLLLEAYTTDERWPRAIKAQGDTQVSIGSSPDNDACFRTIDISEYQGTVGWSKEHGKFVYHCTGNSVPVVYASDALVAEQENICEALSPVPAMAKVMLEKVDKLLQRIGTYQKQIKVVQDLEASMVDHPGRGARGFLPGGKTEDSQMGYALWLESLAMIFNERLSEQDKDNVQKMVEVLYRMAADRAALRQIENYCDYPLTGDFRKRMDDYVEAKNAELEAHGEVYLVTGFHGHHTVSRIRRDEGGKMLLTVYNAGAESVPVAQSLYVLPQDKVMGIYEREIKPGTDLKKLILALSEKKIRTMYNDDYGAFVKQIDDCLVPGLVRHKEVPAQTRGNCTTRSTRHALEDVLGDGLMKLFGRYVADPEVSAAEDLKQALEMRRDKLQNILGIENGPDELDRTIRRE